MIKQAIKKAKKFIRTHIIDNSKFLTSLNQRRIKRAREASYFRHQQMSYAQIEAEISESYENIFNRKLNWDTPQAYTEKMQVAKVYMPTPEKTRLADKYLVRKWIREKVGEQYLIPLYGVYDSFDEIDFNSLPDKFVIKCNHDSGSVTLVSDKSKINIPELKKKYDILIKRNFAWLGWEMHYLNIKPKILIEEFKKKAINNYEFLCFDGKPCICWVDFDHLKDRRRNVYDLNWNILPFNISCCQNYPTKINCPDKFAEMKEIASTLSQGFNMVRVDFYLVDEKIYFEEMTFTSGNGFSLITPDEYDYKLGALWPFDNSVRKKILSEHSSPLN